MFGNKKDQMHPDDRRNMIIFFVIAVGLYFTYNAFVLEPQALALKKAREAQVLMADTEKAAPIPATPDKPVERAVAITGSRLKINNGAIFGTIALTGGRIDDIALTDYFETLEKKDHVAVLSPKGTEFPRAVEYGWIAQEKDIHVPGADTTWSVEGTGDLTTANPLTLVWDNGQGLKFERKIAVDENFMFTVTQKVTNNSGRKVTLFPYGLITQTGRPKDFQKIWFMHEGPMGYIGDKLEQVKYDDLRKNPAQTFEADAGWLGVTDKYWLTAMIPVRGEMAKYRFTFEGGPLEKHVDKGQYQVDYLGAAHDVEQGQSTESESHLFTGAKKVTMLEDYGKALEIPHFDLAVDFGMFWFMTKPFFYALHFLAKITGNLGISIIILTLLIRGAAFPLTNTSYRSFAKMKKVTPQVNALREQHGADKAKLQQELMQMYQREGVNPMAGCLPIFLQIPIFFALYKVLFLTIEVRHAPFFGWIQDLSAPDPTTVFNLFGLIPWTPPHALHIGVWPCLMLVAMIIQKKLNPPPQDPLQRDLANYFPFIICYTLSRFASGLVVYWTFSAFIGIAQQMFIMRSLGVPIHLLGQSEEEKKLDKSVDKGPSVHPLAGMAEEEVEDVLFGDDDGGPPKPISPPKPKKKQKR